MVSQTSITIADDHLLVVVSGHIRTIEEIAAYSKRYREESNRVGIRRILLDYRKATFHLDYHDLIKLAEYASNRNFHLHGLRTAGLCKAEELEKHLNYQTLAGNRSMIYRVFTDEAEALEWLLRPDSLPG